MGQKIYFIISAGRWLFNGQFYAFAHQIPVKCPFLHKCITLAVSFFIHFHIIIIQEPKRIGVQNRSLP